MAIIYTYPTKTTLATSDLILISDSADSNKTKNATVTSIKDAIDVVDSITATSPLVASGSTGAITLSIPAATSGVNGYLTSTNWSTFNGKQEELQSGVNIKTINSNSILGSGDLVISGAAANPAGSAGEIQYNNDGTSFGALPFFTTNRADKVEIAYELGLKGDGTNHGLLKLYCEAGTAHHVGIKGPNHTGAASYTIQLPNSIATTSAHSSGGRILESDASGELKWIATPTGGSGGPGTGTQYTLPIWSTTSTLGDSLITQDSDSSPTTLTIGSSTVTSAIFSATAGAAQTFSNTVSVSGQSAASIAGQLSLRSPNGATYTTIEGPANGGTAYAIKMPNAVGTPNQVLKLPSTIPGSGASQLVWGDATGGVTYTFSTGLSESGGTVTLNAGLNNLIDVSYAGTNDASMYIGNGAPSGLVGTPTKTTAVGEGAGNGTTSGSSNTLIGTNAGREATTGSTNTLIGSDAGDTLTTGGGNVLIGASADANANNVNAGIAIGKNTIVSTSSIAIGDGAQATGASGSCIAIGRGATTTSNRTALGSSSYPIKTGTPTDTEAPTGYIEIQINGDGVSRYIPYYT